MANIRIDLSSPIIEGQSLTFRSPADCSQVTGLIVYYPENDSTVSKTFRFADAHGNNIGDLDLFASDSLVKIILDIQSSLAFVQNADTNAYLETRFDGKQDKHKPIEVTLLVDGWVDNSQTIAVESVTVDNTIIVSPTSASRTAYCEANAYCSSQGDKTLTFECEDTPSTDLIVNVVILN